MSTVMHGHCQPCPAYVHMLTCTPRPKHCRLYSPAAVHHEAYAVHHEAYAVHHEAYAVHHEAYAVHHEAYAVHREAYAVHREAYAVHYEAYAVHHEAYAVHREAYAVHHEAYAVNMWCTANTVLVLAVGGCTQLSAVLWWYNEVHLQDNA